MSSAAWEFDFRQHAAGDRVAILCVIPVVFLMKKAQPGGEIAVIRG